MLEAQYTPVIIIGAPRSGTNMLRDALTSLVGVSTWPCDEINLIWRHGNLRFPSDAFAASMASPAIIRFIRSKFAARANAERSPYVVEKTCANSLRVPFVRRVLPEARFLFITRNGYDATASAMKRWQAPLELRYTLRKARFVPISDIPYYFARYIWNRGYRILSRKSRLAAWGPVFPGMREALRHESLSKVCALQWAHCVESSRNAFEGLPAESWLHVSYEEFVADPQRNLERICEFLGLPATRNAVGSAVREVTAGSVGRGRACMAPDVLQSVRAVIEPVMQNVDEFPGRNPSPETTKGGSFRSTRDPGSHDE